MTHDKRFIIKEIDSEEKAYLISIAQDLATYVSDNKTTVLAKIYGFFSLKKDRQDKVYFIIMHNLGVFPENSVAFKYDLKFSEYNRKNLELNDIEMIKCFLLGKSDIFRDIIDFINDNDEESKLEEDESYLYTRESLKSPNNKGISRDTLGKRKNS
jgi:hypothetical protein